MSGANPAGELLDASDALRDAAHATIDAEIRAETAEEIAARAQAEIDAAHEHAANIMKSAMETALGQRIQALEDRMTQWQETSLRLLQAELTAELAPMLTAIQSLMEAEEEPEPVIQSSIPAVSLDPETVSKEAETENSGKSADQTSPKTRKTGRWI